MTVSEIIEKSKTALVTQGCKALKLGTASGCLYRGPNNTRCAIGWLIPDDKYLSEIEDTTIDSILENYESFSFLLPTDADRESGILFLQELQNIHDSTYVEVENWPLEFQKLAEKWSR